MKDRDLSRFDRNIFDEALDSAYKLLDKEYAESCGLDKGLNMRPKMGTTLAFACFHQGGVFVAHIGDSRVYHVRRRFGGGAAAILHRTQDHSHVAELVMAGLITEEEALSHPKKNVITRAMQPSGEKRAKADICEISDIRRGDYIFMCTDGIRESVSDTMLCKILGAKGSTETKVQAIECACKKNSKDNFSAYLVPIESVEKARIKSIKAVMTLLRRILSGAKAEKGAGAND
jgi:protein phosphatase